MAPERLDPETFGLDSSIPTKESDVYTFGRVCVEVSVQILVTLTNPELCWCLSAVHS